MESEEKKIERPGLENLVSLATRSTEEVREIARKGGINSGKVRKARKTGREIVEQLAKMNLSADQVEDALGEYKSILGEDMTAYTVMYAKAFLCANQGDIKAATFIRDTVGDKPDDKIQLETDSITDGDRELLQNVASALLEMGIDVAKQSEDEE